MVFVECRGADKNFFTEFTWFYVSSQKDLFAGS